MFDRGDVWIWTGLLALVAAGAVALLFVWIHDRLKGRKWPFKAGHIRGILTGTNPASSSPKPQFSVRFWTSG
jgi:hypothetical protein